METNQETYSKPTETYLVFVKKPEGGVSADDLDSWYKSFLPATIPTFQIPFHQKLRQHLMMKAMGLTRPAQQLEILYIMPMLGNANGTAGAFLKIQWQWELFERLIQEFLMVCSAGNEGSYNGSLSNEAPWILTVGASTIDGSIRADVLWEIRSLFFGESLFQPNSPPYMSPVYTGSHGSESAAFCAPESLSDIDVRDKIVLCEGGGGTARSDKGQTVKDAGDAAMILMSDKEG
ncbi:hypothetical protein OIU77_023088 [Salix suchowensis]|uniref:PA domain-containing protein n=1 Tax=Salix suchowensis TaxID=1278906 RepID=A0ABQ9C2L4_9ROSI|nr:hypothetical protein OIU77_023088 [Salix suchowensis]